MGTCSGPSFSMDERVEPDGSLRLALGGELDLVAAEPLGLRVYLLSRMHSKLVLDLSRLRFIDSTGIAVVLGAVRSAGESDKCRLSVDPNVTGQVRRLIELVRADELLWGN
jgi:anti-anti-sigma factor